MTRTLFALAVAGAIFVSVSAASQAAPMAPLPAGAAADHAAVTQVYWHGRWGWRRGWGWHRHCWRGWRGYIHCR
jgi:Spy/CpxP family protein refolding chaperone